MANINAESEMELSTSKSESKVAENEMSNVNGKSSDAKGSVEEKNEEQVSTRATDGTEKCDVQTLPPESTQSDSSPEREPMDDADTSNNELSEEKENAEKPPAERLKNSYKLEFNADGGLCDTTDKNKCFDFNYYDSHYKNQDRYDKIGNIVTEIIYDKMEKEQRLERVHIGEEEPGKKRSFFFASKAMLDEEQRKKEKLLVIIHGSGAVRAGQWARSIIINDKHGLETGTQIPYIRMAQQQGFSVIVTNTNENYDRSDGWRNYSESYEHSGSPEQHAEYVWEKYARHAGHIAIVAHSYGGVVVTRLADKFPQDFDEKVFAIALTDSVHGGSMRSRAKRIFADRARNWVTSDKEVDTPVKSFWGNSEREDASRVSAGHVKHEWTSHACINSVFVYFDKMFSSFIPYSSAAASGEKRSRTSPTEERYDDDDNSDNSMDEDANCVGSRSPSAAAGNPSEPRSPAAVETCADSSNTNCAPKEQREAGDGAAAEASEPCPGHPESRQTDGEGEGQPRHSNDNDVMSTLGP